MARKKRGFPRLAIGIIEVIGLGIAVFLMLISMGVIYAGEIPCPRGRIFACHSVLRGKFSHMGPFPIAHMGVLYFVVQLALTWALGRFRAIPVLKVLMTVGGVAFVGYLRSIEILWMRAMCPWCLVVALMVVIESVLIYPMAMPPLPKVGWFGRTVLVLLFFFAVVGITCAGGQFIRIPKTLPPKPVTPTRKPAVETPRATATPKPRANGRTNGAQKTPKPTPVPEPDPTPMAEDADLLPYPDTPEGLVFRDRQWRLVANTEALHRIIDAEAPVLLLVYDPYCPVCEQVITKVLSDERMDLLPITKVAIDQRELIGDISTEVANVPTLLLLGPGGQIVFKHEGLIGLDDLMTRVERGIGLRQ